ncbi:MAG: MmcQ/YjbR family DNA-binding protein [Gemmatimonadales bacterium]
MTPAAVRKAILAFPGVEEGPSYGTRGFKVKGKFLARFRDDETVLVLRCGFDERDFRLRADPVTFFVEPHYDGYPAILLRIRRVRPTVLREVLTEAWRRQAPKRLIAAHDLASRASAR